MHHAKRMSLIESAGDLLEIEKRLSWGATLLVFEHFGERSGCDQRRHKIGIAILLSKVVGGQNIRMIELGQPSGQTGKAIHKAVARLSGEVIWQDKDGKHNGSSAIQQPRGIIFARACGENSIDFTRTELLFYGISTKVLANELG